MEIFNIKNLSFKYPDNQQFALKDINLTIKKGDIVLICGSSGCGKTTLLSHLKTVMTPFGERCGDINFCGLPLSETSEREQAKKIGYVLQDPARQQVTDKVWHEMAFGAENLGLQRDEMKRRIAETANFFGIDKWFHRDISTLSGGQKQLLNLACIMVMQPEVLLLDEPTASLDPVAANELLNALYRINSELGTTIIIVEHRTRQIVPHRHKVVYMENGEIVFSVSPADIKISDSDISKYMPVPAQVAGEFIQDKLPLDIREGRQWLSDFSHDFMTKAKVATEKSFSGEDSIVLKDVCFRYTKDGQDILKNLCLNVPKGCVYAILGGNGSGKSTLLKVIADISRPYNGKVKTRSRVVYMPQEARLLFSEDSVKKELEITADGKDIQETCNLCQIEELLDKHPYDISVGQAQRVGLAKLLLTGADILLLDEVTRGTDPYFKEKLGQILQELAKMGKTVLIVSHDIEFCAQYADKIGLFFDGEICSEDVPETFFINNNFYTTQAVRMSRDILKGCISGEDIVRLCRENI